MIKNFLPNKILSLSNFIFTNLISLLIIIITIGLIYSLVISPPDYIQGDSVRIMYVHVPSSFIALGCFGFIGFVSILNLVFKIKFMSFLGKSLVQYLTLHNLNIFTSNRQSKDKNVFLAKEAMRNPPSGILLSSKYLEVQESTPWKIRIRIPEFYVLCSCNSL